MTYKLELDSEGVLQQNYAYIPLNLSDKAISRSTKLILPHLEVGVLVESEDKKTDIERKRDNVQKKSPETEL